MMDFQNSNGGLMGSLHRVSDAVMSLCKNRAELATVELKEEKSRLVTAAVWAGIFVFSSIMAIIAISCTLLFYFWDQRLNIAIGLLAFSLLGAIVAFFLVKRRLKTPMPFAETIAQFKKDRAWLQG
jgi:uncharacterized membrane protein YqjE